MPVALLAISLPFVAIAGVMAALITYEEMQRRFDHRRALREAVRTGIAAAAFLLALSAAAAALLTYLGR